MKKIVFTGPESSGKTKMTEMVAAHFGLPYVKEIAREYIDHIKRTYNYEDVLNIALLQMAEEEKIKSQNPPVLICDTDLLTIQIWCDDKYKHCEDWITSSLFDRKPDMYFLCNPDFPWEFDKQREDEFRRDHIHGMYKSFLKHHHLKFIELSGPVEQRINTVLAYLNDSNRIF